MKLGIVGTRRLDSYQTKAFVFSIIKDHIDTIEYLVSGGAEGPDTYAMDWINNYGGSIILHRPNYIKYGNPNALFKRNSLIVRDSSDMIAIWDGKSSGTKDSIQKAKNMNTPIMVYIFDSEFNCIKSNLYG